MEKWAIGVDIGGTKTGVAAVDAKGKILSKIHFETKSSPSNVVDDIVHHSKKFQDSFNTPPAVMGVGIAGEVDKETGLVHFVPNLKWHEIPLKQMLQSYLVLPITIMNDVRTATWGEWKYGAGVGCDDIFCLLLGTGIGGGVVSSGHLLHGYSNTIAEVGHMIIDMDGLQCTCGNWGCFETLAGGWGLAQQAKKAILIDPDGGSAIAKLCEEKNSEITAKIVVEAYRKGDLFADHLIQKLFEAAGVGAANIINLFNPEKLILGGGLMAGLPEIKDHIEQAMRERCLVAASKGVHVVLSHLGENAVTVGAATYALLHMDKRAARSALEC